MPVCTRRRIRIRSVPAAVWIHVALLPEDLGQAEYRDRVKNIARRWLLGQLEFHGRLSIDVHDEEIWRLIAEARRELRSD